MTADQIAYWENVLKKMVEQEEWKRELEKRYWKSHFLTSAETVRFLKSQYEQYKVLLGELGLAR
jgi:tripartite-type tricarboxylate transporter receptor subunit TctC